MAIQQDRFGRMYSVVVGKHSTHYADLAMSMTSRLQAVERKYLQPH